MLFLVFCIHFVLLLLFSNSAGNSQTIQIMPRSGSLIFVPFSAIRIPAVVTKKVTPSSIESKRFSKQSDARPPSNIPLTQGEEPVPPPILVPINLSTTLTPEPNSADIIDKAKRDIGKIDKELRGKAPLVLSERADSFRAKLEHGISDAYVGHSDTTEDHYTAPDGVVYTRISKNGRSYCYMSGTTNFVPGILHNSDSTKTVNCPPANSGWMK